MGARKKLGRPPEILNRVKLFIYVTAGERQAIARAARRADVSTSAWVRAVALAALKHRTGRTT